MPNPPAPGSPDSLAHTECKWLVCGVDQTDTLLYLNHQSQCWVFCSFGSHKSFLLCCYSALMFKSLELQFNQVLKGPFF